MQSRRKKSAVNTVLSFLLRLFVSHCLWRFRIEQEEEEEEDESASLLPLALSLSLKVPPDHLLFVFSGCRPFYPCVYLRSVSWLYELLQRPSNHCHRRHAHTKVMQKCLHDTMTTTRPPPHDYDAWDRIASFSLAVFLLHRLLFLFLLPTACSSIYPHTQHLFSSSFTVNAMHHDPPLVCKTINHWKKLIHYENPRNAAKAASEASHATEAQPKLTCEHMILSVLSRPSRLPIFLCVCVCVCV